jgi:hypothetical protein
MPGTYASGGRLHTHLVDRCHESGIWFFDLGQDILGIVLQGLTVACLATSLGRADSVAIIAVSINVHVRLCDDADGPLRHWDCRTGYGRFVASRSGARLRCFGHLRTAASSISEVIAWTMSPHSLPGLSSAILSRT